MTMHQSGTVVLLAHADDHPPNFARLVAAFRAILAPVHGRQLELGWDCDDLAMFDLPTGRIALGWDDRPANGNLACLLVSVAPRPDVATCASPVGHEEMCAQLVRRLHERHPALAIRWLQAAEAPRADLPDALPDGLPPSPGDRAGPEPDVLVDPLPRAASAQGGAEAANDRPALPATRSAELARLREALYPANPEELVPARMNAKLRLAAHAMNATLILVWAPLGAAAMTYAILRGEDMRFSARLVVLTGLFASAINAPMIQRMAALAGV
ncbi:MAG: hypothetical protein KF887_05990 [Paracoccaceae bacterium]|nr:MAG: hypothetical protein KF887_05990 [Paracoccaceae bacterium]